MANNTSSNKADITGIADESPGPKSVKNASGDRVKTISGPKSSVAKGGLSPRTSAPIINGH
jgi:hypothetical protein